MRTVTSILALTAALLPANALAGSIESSEDIVKFFVDAADAANGGHRGLCIGTVDFCKSKDDAGQPTNLDMSINFALDSADLTPVAQANLSKFVEALKDVRLKDLTFVVEGHTDASGSAVYNLGLSQLRAQSVTGFLLSRAIESSRIDAIGMGETRPTNADPYDPANRRVDMRINRYMQEVPRLAR